MKTEAAAPSGTVKQQLAVKEAWELPQELLVFLENPRGPELQLKMSGMRLETAQYEIWPLSFLVCGPKGQELLVFGVVNSRERLRFPCTRGTGTLPSRGLFRMSVGGGAASVSGQAHEARLSSLSLCAFLRQLP